MQSFLQSFRSSTRPDLIKVVADSFPTAGPFYVGWCEYLSALLYRPANAFRTVIFTTAMHGGFELALRTSRSFTADVRTDHFYSRCTFYLNILL